MNPSISAAVADFAPISTLDSSAARAGNLRMFQELHRLGAVGCIEHLSSAWELSTLARSHSGGTMFASTLKIGEFELSIKSGKLTSYEQPPLMKPFMGDCRAPDPEGFVRKGTTLYLKGGDPATDAVEARFQSPSACPSIGFSPLLC
jgi:hypothetical protein